MGGTRSPDPGEGTSRHLPGKCFAAMCFAGYEVTLMEAALASRFIAAKPERLIGDRAYGSDPLDERLREQGIEMIAPHRRNRVKSKTQDGRKLKVFKRPWKIERLVADSGVSPFDMSAK